MDEKNINILMLWAIAASIATVVLLPAWSNSNSKWDAVMGDDADYTIEDLI